MWSQVWALKSTMFTMARKTKRPSLWGAKTKIQQGWNQEAKTMHFCRDFNCSQVSCVLCHKDCGDQIEVVAHERHYGTHFRWAWTYTFVHSLCREIGGQMSPMWPRYYSQCRSVCFVVDISQPVTMAEATIEFYELLNHEDMKVCAIAFNRYCPSNWSLCWYQTKTTKIKCAHILSNNFESIL